MELAEYKNMYQNEGSHYFYAATHQLVLSLLQRFTAGKRRPLKILDAGCGTGLLTQKMQPFGEVVGIDFSPEALKFARKRKVRVQRASIEKIPFSDNTFDVVVSIDVLTASSIKNDLIPLQEFYRVLKPNGILIMRVSAFPWLKLIHDRHVHMNHRYEKKELAQKLRQTGFHIEKLSFIHSVLFPLIIIRHFWENLIQPKATKSAVDETHPAINSLLTWVLIAETKVFMKLNLPFGLGLVAAARKS